MSWFLLLIKSNKENKDTISEMDLAREEWQVKNRCKPNYYFDGCYYCSETFSGIPRESYTCSTCGRYHHIARSTTKKTKKRRLLI